MNDAQEPFDPTDPVAEAEEIYRQAVLDIVLRLMDDPKVSRLGRAEQFPAEMGGLLTGVLCVLMAELKPEGHVWLRDSIRDNIDYLFAQARSCFDLPPLDVLPPLNDRQVH